jgi:acyl-coenzyme A thioesterase 9
MGVESQLRRRAEFNQSLDRDYPNEEESKLLHQMFLRGGKGKEMSQTRVDKNTLMHTQDRNIHGRAFGGFIMKEIVELGWLCSYKHVCQHTCITHIFDV